MGCSVFPAEWSNAGSGHGAMGWQATDDIHTVSICVKTLLDMSANSSAFRALSESKGNPYKLDIYPSMDRMPLQP